MREDPDTGEERRTRHGSLVMDWVEVFAPVVFEPHRPSAWPEAGSVLLDDLPFSVRDPTTGRQRIVFRVFCAMGYDGDRARMLRTEAFTSKSQAHWEHFLHGLDGAPPRVATTMAASPGRCGRSSRRPSCTSVSGTCGTRWSASCARSAPTERQSTRFCRASKRRSPARRSGSPFVREAHQAGIPRLDAWLVGTGQIVEDQFRRRGLRSNRPANMPLSTSPMDAFIHRAMFQLTQDIVLGGTRHSSHWAQFIDDARRRCSSGPPQHSRRNRRAKALV